MEVHVQNINCFTCLKVLGTKIKLNEDLLSKQALEMKNPQMHKSREDLQW